MHGVRYSIIERVSYMGINSDSAMKENISVALKQSLRYGT